MITCKAIAQDGLVIVIDGPESISRFKDLVQRGANLFPDAHPEIKTFADLVTSGKVLQDYYSAVNLSAPV